MKNQQNGDLEMFDFFEMTPVLVCIAGKDGYFKKVNPAVISTFGYTEQELYGRPIADLIHPEDKNLTSEEREKLLKGKALVNFQNRYISRQGETIWLEWTSIYFSDREIVFAIANNITGKKKAELETEARYEKFKNLASHFKSSIEVERKFLAIELHEELAQLASVIKMDIDYVKDTTPLLTDASKARLENAVAVSNILISAMRRLSFSLSPQMLYDHGLNETLEWYAREFSGLNGIPCLFETNYDENTLSPDVELDFFRISQEALGNIMHHAKASTVKIILESSADQVRLVIEDNGKDYDRSQPKIARGMTGIRERAASMNAELTLDTGSIPGTRISLTFSKNQSPSPATILPSQKSNPG